MTANQKAQELVDSYYVTLDGFVTFEQVKKCALISVNEILESNNTLLKLDSIGLVFWKQVKKEIEKL